MTIIHSSQLVVTLLLSPLTNLLERHNMLGWEIYIHRSDSGHTLEATEFTQESVVAKWRAGIGGYDWIKALLKENKAKALGGNGYPFLFSAKFDVLKPVILNSATSHNGPMVIGDDYVLPSNYLERPTINKANLLKCQSDDDMCIQVWDMS